MIITLCCWDLLNLSNHRRWRIFDRFLIRIGITTLQIQQDIIIIDPVLSFNKILASSRDLPLYHPSLLFLIIIKIISWNCIFTVFFLSCKNLLFLLLQFIKDPLCRWLKIIEYISLSLLICLINLINSLIFYWINKVYIVHQQLLLICHFLKIVCILL